MDQLEPWGVIIAAALGSAGLSGALTGAVQFSRAARAARVIEHIKKALEGGETGSGERALRLALDRERARLASLTFVGTPQIYVQILALLVVTAGITIGVFSTGLVSVALPWGRDRDGDGVAGEIGDSASLTWLVAAIFLAYIVFFAFVTDLAIKRRRARFMDDIGAADADVEEVARKAVRFRR